MARAQLALISDVHGNLPWWRDELDDDQVDWLAGLPFCHDLLASGRRERLRHAASDTVHRRPDPAPFALSFVRVPYDVEAELRVAAEEAGEFTLDTYYHGPTS